MKNLLFYTFHRHLEEIFFSSMFFNRSKFLRENFDVYLHCNNSAHNVDMIKSMSKFETSVDITVTNKNAGYDWGLPESQSDCYERCKKYDRVIYIQPDCYIVDDTKLSKDFEDDFEALVSPIFHFGRDCYTGDFFALKTGVNIFEDWERASRETPTYVNGHCVYPHEHYVTDCVNRNFSKIKTFSRLGHRERLIDSYGLWHEHNNLNVAKHLGLI